MMGRSIGKIYILLSIKTRIETLTSATQTAMARVFISYYPLKQGLKHPLIMNGTTRIWDLYPTIH